MDSIAWENGSHLYDLMRIVHSSTTASQLVRAFLGDSMNVGDEMVVQTCRALQDVPGLAVCPAFARDCQGTHVSL